MRSFARNSLFLLVLTFAAAACGDGGPDAAAGADTGATGRLVSPAEGAGIVDTPPEDLVILDVRTPEEFAEGHIDGAVLVDFYDEDFGEQLAALDPAVPYLVYCRSGNRSGQAMTMMQGLGFDDVADVDGGIIAWSAEGYEISP